MAQEDWKNGLFEADCNSCMGAWFCGCCMFGRTQERMKTFPNTSPEHINTCNECCFAMFATSWFHLGWIPLLVQRGRMREKLGIKGNGCNDCLVSLFCSCCAISQMDGEVKKRTPSQKSNGGQYVQNSSIKYEVPSER